MAEILKQVKGSVSSINPAMGAEGMIERFQLSAHHLAGIAENQALQPGRKLLIWVSAGWPMLNKPSDAYSEKDQRRNFDGIVELSTKLREGRMTVYSVSPLDTGSVGAIAYQGFLKPVRRWQEAEPGNLALKVLATESGGLVLGPDNDIAGQIDRCVADASAFYRISFNPPSVGRADEYHELHIAVDRPEAMVRTNTGYYDQP